MRIKRRAGPTIARTHTGAYGPCDPALRIRKRLRELRLGALSGGATHGLANVYWAFPTSHEVDVPAVNSIPITDIFTF